MKDIGDIDKLLEGIQKPATQTGINGLTEMLQEGDKVLKQMEVIVSRIDSMGLKPLIVRGLGIKLGVDPETPLRTDSTGIVPQSPVHEQLLSSLNKLPPEQLQEFVNNANAETVRKQNAIEAEYKEADD